MQHAQNFDKTVANTIRQDVWRSSDRQFAGIRYAARASGGRRVDQDTRCVENTPGHGARGLRIVFFDVLSERDQIAERLVQPGNLHSGGLRSLGSPQLVNQRSISS